MIYAWSIHVIQENVHSQHHSSRIDRIGNFIHFVSVFFMALFQNSCHRAIVNILVRSIPFGCVKMETVFSWIFVFSTNTVWAYEWHLGIIPFVIWLFFYEHISKIYFGLNHLPMHIWACVMRITYVLYFIVYI